MYFTEKNFLEEFYGEASFFSRALVQGFKQVFRIYPGDVLEIFFFHKGSSYIFEGVCLGVKRKKLVAVDSMFTIRNFIQNIGVECIFSYYYNRLYVLRINDYKEKAFVFSRAKLFFLRQRLQETTTVN